MADWKQVTKVDPATGNPVGAPAAAAPAAPAPSSTDLTPGAVYMSQQDYVNSKADPTNLKRFINDWINLGGRGVIGGDGKPASYWDVYQNLLHDGIDVSDLPAPETLVQGQTKGGGSTNPMTQPSSANPTAPPPAPTSPELTDLLKTIGVNYQNAPAATPALLAFLRQLQGNMSSAEDTRNSALRLIGNRAATSTDDINRVADATKQNVTADLVRRGVLQSGEATNRYNIAATDKASKLTNVANTTAEGSAAADTAYQSGTDALRQSALEKVMQTEMEQQQTAGQSAAQTQALQAQKDAADLAYQRSSAATKAYQDWYEQQIKAGQPAVSGA